MFRSALRPYFAALLLLCLGRTLLPEAWVVAWHPHAHTTREPAYAYQPLAGKRLLVLTARHQHCHAEQFYNVPFAPGSIVAVVVPARCQRYLRQLVLPLRGRAQTAGRSIAPRGPPARA